MAQFDKNEAQDTILGTIDATYQFSQGITAPEEYIPSSITLKLKVDIAATGDMYVVFLPALNTDGYTPDTSEESIVQGSIDVSTISVGSLGSKTITLTPPEGGSGILAASTRYVVTLQVIADHGVSFGADSDCGYAGGKTGISPDAGSNWETTAPEYDAYFIVEGTATTSVPVITEQSSSSDVEVGDEVELSVTASGSPTPTYQWKKGVNPISGATSSTYAFTAVGTSGGTYTCVVTNSRGSDTTDDIVICVKPHIISVTGSGTYKYGQTVSFVATVEGTATITYQWKLGGVSISGATSSTYSFSTDENSPGTYTLVATNAGGFDTSSGDWGEVIVLATQKIYSRYLVAACDGSIYYGSSPTTMALLAASEDDINMNYRASLFTGDQKVFVLNDIKFRVVDFGNYKLHTTSIGTTLPSKGTILEGGTSKAKMITDFITTSTGACYVYGYKLTPTLSFASGETVTEVGSAVSFVLDANEVGPPHWYSWTPYGNDTTNYGTMPTRATAGCWFRGRAVLVGDAEYPHQWYQAEVLNPWNWLYDSNSAISPIRGADADLGEVGDILVCPIPYKDDYLVYGCANSWWIQSGDAAENGSIQNITLDTGLWSSTAWCIDGKGNLIFLGKSGLYQMPIGMPPATPVCLTSAVYPKMMDDLDLDHDLHTVTLAYDSDRNGVMLSVTTDSTGANKCYWIDILTGGLYPIQVATNAAIRSTVYFQALDQADAGALYGCSDGGLREFKDSVENDEQFSPTADSAIISYMALPIRSISNYPGREAVFNFLRGTTTGGAAAGTFGDTDTVTWSVYTANDAETVLETIKDGNIVTAGVIVSGGSGYAVNDVLTVAGGTGTAATFTVASITSTGSGETLVSGIISTLSFTSAGSYTILATNPVSTTVAPTGGTGCILTLTWKAYAATGTWTTPGMQIRNRVNKRGRYGTVVLSDATASKSWGIEMITGDFTPVGKE